MWMMWTNRTASFRSPLYEVHSLAFIFCALLDMPDDGIDCSFSNRTYSCIKCSFSGGFMTGGSLTDEASSTGKITCTILWVICCLVGVFGTVGNYLIFRILGKTREKGAFDTLLTALSFWDMILCFLCIVDATALNSYIQNWDRSSVTVITFLLAHFLSLLGSTTSSFMTVLITIERFIMVKFAIRSRSWFTARKTKWMCVGVICFSIVLNIPRNLDVSLQRPYPGMETIHAIHDMEFLLFYSDLLYDYWMPYFYNVDNQIDFWGPVILLLTFNGLLLHEIKKIARRRRRLTNSAENQEILFAKMFFPVVAVLFICKVVPLITFLTIQYHYVIYRELLLASVLAVAVNSAANLPIYYNKRASFRNEIQKTFANWRERQTNAYRETFTTLATFLSSKSNSGSDSGRERTQEHVLA